MIIVGWVQPLHHKNLVGKAWLLQNKIENRYKTFCKKHPMANFELIMASIGFGVMMLGFFNLLPFVLDMASYNHFVYSSPIDFLLNAKIKGWMDFLQHPIMMTSLGMMLFFMPIAIKYRQSRKKL